VQNSKNIEAKYSGAGPREVGPVFFVVARFTDVWALKPLIY